MSDYDSQLPVRSKDDVDERILVKIQDGENPAGVGRTVEVSEKKAHVRQFNKDSDGNDQEVLLSQEGHQQSNGYYDPTTNKRPSSQGMIASERVASHSEESMTQRVTAVDGEGNTVCLDVALHDATGQRFDEDNPFPVYVAESPAEEIDVFDRASAVAKNASANHDYTVTAGLRLKSVEAEASASGYARFELQVESAPTSGVFNTVMVKFNSTARPDVFFKYAKSIDAGSIVRIVKTNKDNQPQDLYSQIRGIEI